MAKEKKKVPNLRFKGFTDDWEQRKLGEISDIKSGLSTNTQSKKNLYKITRIETISDGFIDVKKVGTVREKPDKKFLMNCGDILFSNINSLKHIGKVAIFDGSFTLYHGMNLLRITVNTKTSSYFIYYELSTKKYRNWAKAHANPAVSQASINQSELSLENMSLTSLAEQEKIVNLLLLLDKLISLQQQKLDLLKQLKKGLLQKMFADKDSKQPILRFKGFHDDWEQRKLSKVKDVRDGTHDSPKYHEKGFPLITSKNLTPSGVDFSDASLIDEHDYQEINKRSLVEIHDILFGMIGTIGNPVIVKKSGFAIKNVALIKHGGNLSNYFLLNLLNSPIFAKYINKENAGGTQKFLSLSIIRNFRFLAPGSDEQNKIGNMFEQVDTFITLQQQKLAKYQSIKKSLLQQMFI